MRMIASGLAAAGLTLVLNVTTTAAAPITFSASGSSPAGIQATVDAYRSDLGTLNPNVAGSFGSGRREINWDGVPDAFSAPNLFPPNFFNTNSPRGVVFTTGGTGFQVSATAASGTPVEFGSINVSRVRITSGNAALGPSEAGALDLVVMDDFLFGEPVAAVPEASTLMLLFGGLLGLGVMWRWRNA